ncbi:hypothetical protein GLAREA_04525 [Glarea lozoyensis ATCC 20868]|uniref:Uncharacterized protein n=1 Tax=Glarea lozoyensis (strain ATCC 20868 / MF5171) TaxID=1116229 RepID=S3CRM2_GLAL2|nr:uncharacterized protein GLAREA_04525 [Glarea lozoyensis ATCC 20868]EPE27734.1 hypothetical protein GLAREA_04525 [Glarea lozoyensis ATCC 20868]
MEGSEIVADDAYSIGCTRKAAISSGGDHDNKESTRFAGLTMRRGGGRASLVNP